MISPFIICFRRLRVGQLISRENFLEDCFSTTIISLTELESQTMWLFLEAPTQIAFGMPVDNDNLTEIPPLLAHTRRPNPNFNTDRILILLSTFDLFPFFLDLIIDLMKLLFFLQLS